MAGHRSSRWCGGVLFALFVGACTNDYGQFAFGTTNSEGDGSTDVQANDATADHVVDRRADSAEENATSSDGRPDVPDVGPPVDASDDGACPSGYKHCGALCSPIDAPQTGCAADSCEACPAVNGVATCLGGACAVLCDPGFADCNGQVSDGCEQTSSDDVAHCGACNRACGTGGVASLECTEAKCVSSCQPGHANCNAPSTGDDDGCERDVASTAKSCGSCANDCTKQGVGFVCAGGACGCTSNAQCHLGGKGTYSCDTATARCVCTGKTCAPGEACANSGGSQVCTCNGQGVCADGQTCCQTPAGCQDLNTDPANCGACGRACPAGFACSAGTCVCDGDADCNGGAFGTCGVEGKCACGPTPCSSEQRCMGDGTCG